jgi:pimeloyl-ACP methyl ester carboxylesterase
MKNAVIKDNLAPLTPLNNASFRFETLGKKDSPVFIWGHGWGQSRGAFRPLAQTMEPFGTHVLVDFPGFGESPAPETVWGTEDYADEAARFIRSQTSGKVIWVGHSFGCRVGLQLAARHPDLIAGLFLIAAAGLKRKRPLWQTVYFKIRVAVYKGLKKMIPLGLVNEEWLKSKFGSADYKNAGARMRGIFVKTVNEDLTEIARTIRCPVALVYGMNDSETPPEIGERLQKLIPGAELTVLPGQDHYTVLGEGRHQVAPILKNFLGRVNA